MIRMLPERAIHMQNDLNLCFVAYTKAFDSVRRKKVLEISVKFVYQELSLQRVVFV